MCRGAEISVVGWVRRRIYQITRLHVVAKKKKKPSLKQLEEKNALLREQLDEVRTSTHWRTCAFTGELCS